MVRKSRTTNRSAPIRFFNPPNVPMSAIRRFARQVAKCYQPDKIMLFGSFAYGEPNENSDVDILVVMATRNEIDQSIRIWQAIDAPFPLDLIVRTPRNLQWRLKEGDWFLREVIGKGKVLYEKVDRPVGTQSRSRSSSGRKSTAG
jgi:predicted nucleotidyltransferase